MLEVQLPAHHAPAEAQIDSASAASSAFAADGVDRARVLALRLCRPSAHHLLAAFVGASPP
jgi:hypothetical protein